MPDRKPQVLRYLKFIVDHTEGNDYGDLTVTSKTGKVYKINKKHSRLHAIFQPDAEVIVGWASYLNRDYIAVAHPADQFPEGYTVEEETLTQQKTPPSGTLPSKPQQAKGEDKSKVVRENMSKDDWAEKNRVTRKSIERQTALNCAVEFAKILMTVKPGIKTEQIVATARVFETYLETGQPVESKLVKEAKKLGAVET